MRPIFFILPLATISSAFAQKDFRSGYIVKDGDTLKGLVRYNNRKYSEQAVFKPARRQKATTYGVDQVSAYGIFGDKRYEAVNMGTTASPKIGFGMLFQKGAIDLYYASDKFFLIKNDELTILQRKMDSIVIGRVTQVTNVNKRHQYTYARDFLYRDQLERIVSDCEIPVPKMLPYSRQQISRIVGDYNQCKKDFVIIKNTRPRIRVGASFGYGLYASSSLTLDSLKGKSLKGDVTSVQEFNLELRFPRAIDRIWLTVGFQPVKTTYTTSATKTSSVQKIDDELTLSVQYYKIPVSAKYSFGNPGYSFYARGGLWLGRLQTVQYTTVRTTTDVNTAPVVTNEKVGAKYRNPGGAFLGLGYDQRLIGSLRLFAELRYEINSGMIGIQQSADSRFNFLSAFVGIGI